jgi:outer membrane protein W
LKKVGSLVLGLLIICTVSVAENNSATQNKVYQPRKAKRASLGICAGYATSSEYGGGAAYGGVFNIKITKNIAFELCGFTFPGTAKGESGGLSKGTLTIIPIQLSVQGCLNVGERLVPYISAGGGYYMNKHRIDSQIASNWKSLGFNISEKVENKISLHFGAGMDVILSSALGLNADLRYCLLNTRGSWVLTDEISGTSVSGQIGNINLNSLVLSISIKIFF